MIGESWIREQGLRDALLLELLRKRGLADVPIWSRDFPQRDAAFRHWEAMARLRDGPVAAESAAIEDVDALTEDIKRRARELGADLVGVARLRPELIELGVSIDHDYVIAVACYERYEKVLEGPDAVELEAMRSYVRCTDIVTELARHIREALGYPALAHHNGSSQVQAIPVMYYAGFGELGKHGSLINPLLGANFRPGFVTTTLPLATDQPFEFGVQDYCMNCTLCTNNCPGDAIPDDFIITNGLKRWLTDVEKCYPYSRLREEYCHICIDVCPYIHKKNEDPGKFSIFKAYMKSRKAEGYKTPRHN
jgi:ferredoxin